MSTVTWWDEQEATVERWPTERLPIVEVEGARITAPQPVITNADAMRARALMRQPAQRTRVQKLGAIAEAMGFGAVLGLLVAVVILVIILALAPSSPEPTLEGAPSTELGMPLIGAVGSTSTTAVGVTSPPSTAEPTRLVVEPTPTAVPSTTVPEPSPLTPGATVSSTTAAVVGVSVTTSTTVVGTPSTGVGTTGGTPSTTCAPSGPAMEGHHWERSDNLSACEWVMVADPTTTTSQSVTTQAVTTQPTTSQPLTTDT